MAARRNHPRGHRLHHTDLRVLQRLARPAPSASLHHAAEVHHCYVVVPLPRLVPTLLPSHCEPHSLLAMSYTSRSLAVCLAIVAVTLIAIASVAVPLYIIRPFVPEDPN